jgi:hypothetical protein
MGFCDFIFLISGLISTLVALYAGRKIVRTCLRLKPFFQSIILERGIRLQLSCWLKRYKS